jgi:nitrile hydratase accessory protein
VTDLPRLPRDEGGPVFAEPWQAQAFALAVTLSQQGHFTWKEWAAALAEELDAAARRGEPDDGSRYYEHWLAALERLVTAKGLTDSTALLKRKAAWISAYQTTPHGRPVELRRSRSADAAWLVLGIACTAATYWAIRFADLGPFGEHASRIGIDAAGLGAGAIVPSIGLAASAGLGTLLGMKHAIEPDHLAAVSTLMSGERSSAKAALLGACWGLGHALTLLVTGALLLVLRAEMPGTMAQAFEACVVLLLVVFGVRAIHLGLAHSHGPTHTHGPRSRATRGSDRWTLGRPLLIGAVHGLAGSGALTALVVTALPSATAQLGYLLLFSVGSILGMAALSGLLGWPIARLGTHHAVTRAFSLAAGGVSVALALSWVHPYIERLL